MAGDGIAGQFLPLPDFFDEFFTAQVVTGDLLGVQLALDHNLGGNACVIRAGDKNRVIAQHPVIAHQTIHDGVIEGMTHVQGACHVGRRKLDHIRRAGRIGVFDMLSGGKIASALPLFVPTSLKIGRLKAFGKFPFGGCDRLVHLFVCPRVRLATP